MNIRPETTADIPLIFEIHRQAFPSNDEARLVNALRDTSNATISLVAILDTQIVGHILFSPLTSSIRALALAPVAVLPQHQNQGIGSALINHGIQLAREHGWEAIFVLGHPSYYPRFGFSVEAARAWDSPYAGDHFMLLPLTQNLPTSGAITYAAPFNNL